MRLFVALEIPQGVKDALVQLRRSVAGELAGSIRWVRPESMHLTLKFLGEVEDRLVESIRDALASVVHPRFVLKVCGVGKFPANGRARVVWAGIEDPVRALPALHEKIECVLDAQGFAPEARGFQAHLTLGRAKDKRGICLARPVVPEGTVCDFGQIPVESFHLKRSFLEPSGARYETVGEWRLLPTAGS